MDYEFELRNYRKNWDAEPINIRFSIPEEWLEEHPNAKFDAEGFFCGLSVPLEAVYRDAVDDGVVRYLEVN